MTRLIVLPRGTRHPVAPRRRGPLTPLGAVVRRDTFTAPVSNPGGATRAEVWSADSADGLWRYERLDEAGTPWAVTFVPTGQSRRSYTSLDDAREATAGTMLAEFRSWAMAAAFDYDHSDASREAGQRWLAVHLRIAGLGEGGDADWRCQCGGLLVEVTSDGRLGHVDACRACYTYGRGYSGAAAAACEHRTAHRVCGTPWAAPCAHMSVNRCAAQAVPNCGAGCGRDGAGDCCGACCHGE